MKKPNKNDMSLTYALGNDNRLKVWFALLKEDGLQITELGLKAGIPQTTVSDQIKILRGAKLIRTERRATAIVCHLTFEGILKEYAKAKRKVITSSDIKAFDDYYLHPKVREIYLESFKARESSLVGIDPLIASTIFLNDIMIAKDYSKDDPELKELWHKVEAVKKKLQ